MHETYVDCSIWFIVDNFNALWKLWWSGLLWQNIGARGTGSTCVGWLVDGRIQRYRLPASSREFLHGIDSLVIELFKAMLSCRTFGVEAGKLIISFYPRRGAVSLQPTGGLPRVGSPVALLASSNQSCVIPTSKTESRAWEKREISNHVDDNFDVWC
jgi:hypothetical protein